MCQNWNDYTHKLQIITIIKGQHHYSIQSLTLLFLYSFRMLKLSVPLFRKWVFHALVSSTITFPRSSIPMPYLLCSIHREEITFFAHIESQITAMRFSIICIIGRRPEVPDENAPKIGVQIKPRCFYLHSILSSKAVPISSDRSSRNTYPKKFDKDRR